MNVRDFAKFIKKEINNDADSFAKNMENLNDTERPLHEWVGMLLTWMELSTEEDARLFYGHIYERDENKDARLYYEFFRRNEDKCQT